MSPTNPDLVCRRVVEVTTDYMEGALPATDSARFEQHLLVCAGCAHYVTQARATVRVLGGLPSEAPSEEARAALLRSFRSVRKERGE